MAQEVRLRGGTTAQHNTFTGASKEVTVDTTKNILVVHDGATPGGHPVAKQSEVDASISTVTDALALKADADDVSDALALKANADDVADSLALKADALAVTNALNLKADADDVAGFLSFGVPQVLTDPQKVQARDNIGFTPALVAYNRWKTIYDDDLPNAIVMNIFDLGSFLSLRMDGSYYAVGASSGLFLQVSGNNGTSWITSNNYHRSSRGIVNGLSSIGEVTAESSQITHGAAANPNTPLGFAASLHSFNKAVEGSVLARSAGLEGAGANAAFDISTRLFGAAAIACNALRLRPSAGTGMGGYLHLEGLPG